MWVKLGQLFLSLTILITLHEFGHFWFAKRFKCKVEKFYLFFDFLFPFATVANFAIFKKKIGDTEYGLGWFPFGGYVSIAGMVDEQMDKSLITKEPEPWELRAKPAWQRLLVMLGGIIVNLILGVVIFWMINFFYGKAYVSTNGLPHGLAVDSTAYKMGLRNGDNITALDGNPVKSLKRIPIELVMDGVKTIEGQHANGEKFSIPVTDNDRSLIMKRLKKSPFVDVRMIPVIDSVLGGSYASNSKLKKNDRIVAVNGKHVTFLDELKSELVFNHGKRVELSYLRGRDTLSTQSMVSEEGTIGLINRPLEQAKIIEENFSFFQALAQGVSDGLEQLSIQAKSIVVMFTVKEAHKQISGFKGMYDQMPEKWNWQNFWLFTAFLSLVLAFMNFLPIPMLDGGYVMFILFEMITRKKVSDKVIYYANQVGLVIVLALMIYANTDFLRN
ncbi:MAG: RIP metalloprotease RseP [Bacteroidetes bacterium]|nr:RIP metalloprotease RseP [Bacteroidota bacterium]